MQCSVTCGETTLYQVVSTAGAGRLGGGGGAEQQQEGAGAGDRVGTTEADAGALGWTNNFTHLAQGRYVEC